MSFIRKNFSSGILATSLLENGGNTTITVNSDHTLPTIPGQFRLVIWNQEKYKNPGKDPDVEIVTASYSGTTNIYNVIRAQEGISAKYHPAGSCAVLVFTAGVSEDDLKFLGQVEVDESALAVDKILVVKQVEDEYKFQYEDKPSGAGTPSDSVVSETSFGQSSDAGSSSDYSRGDHTHGTPTNPVIDHEVAYNHELLHSHANKTVLDTYTQVESSLVAELKRYCLLMGT